MSKYYLGIDTSAYTTSIATVDIFGKVIADYRQVLEVKKGMKGLRQQEAVFQHINNIPILISKLSKDIDFRQVSVVSASTKPRNTEESYMPVFKVSQMQAYVIAKALNVKYKEFSHQEGHIAAAIMSLNKKLNNFLALHISGGTTELLKITDNKKNYIIEIIGGTKDISAGQLIDRIGVKMGYNFPCGHYLDLIANESNNEITEYPISTSNSWINFSGTETYFYKLLQQNKFCDKDIAKSIFCSIGYSLKNILEYSVQKYKIKDIIIIGGVASNRVIRNILYNHIKNKGIGNIYFPDPKYCTDNAVGIAYLGSIKEGFNREEF